MGLPLLGRTLAFVGDTFGFIGDGRARHGGTFRTRILGVPTVFIAGPAACEVWLDESKITRDGAFPPNIEALFGGESLPMMDGDAHKARKRLLLAGFDRAALEAYAPLLQARVEDHLARWCAVEEVRLIGELQTVALEGIARRCSGSSPAARCSRRSRRTTTRCCGGSRRCPTRCRGAATRRGWRRWRG